MDRNDEAYQHLEVARFAHEPNVAYPLSDPYFRPLRDDPRFAALARAKGLPVPRAAETSTAR